MKNKITITDELKEANEGKLDAYETGQEVEFTRDEGDNDCEGPCAGHWVKIGGNCICNPAPEEEDTVEEGEG